jgi:hypothetical protein
MNNCRCYICGPVIEYAMKNGDREVSGHNELYLEKGGIVKELL